MAMQGIIALQVLYYQLANLSYSIQRDPHLIDTTRGHENHAKGGHPSETAITNLAFFDHLGAIFIINVPFIS